MEYRKIPRGQEKLSTIGIGGTHLHEIPPSELQKMVAYAFEQGINLVDTAIAYPEALENIGLALYGKRDKFFYQLHLGLTFPEGQYVRSRKVAEVQAGFEAQLKKLNTDYADLAFIHYVDEHEDFAEVFAGGLFSYAQKLQREGKVKYLGFASHNVEICQRFLQTGGFDMCLFSINPAYDLDPVKNTPFPEFDTMGQEQLTSAEGRRKFYQQCEKLGVGIQVMKAYGGGILLDERTSPFGRALTVNQCLQYALDRPAVLSCLLGVRSVADLQEAVNYYTASQQEKDYAFIAGLQHQDMCGLCVYCNHCLPCPAELDIAAVHKYLDLFLVGDQLARQHYLSLNKKATDCLMCGSCEKNCPFQVKVREKMAQAKKVFAK